MKKRLTGKKYYTHDEVKDHYIGKRGTLEREQYEMELRLDLIGEMIRKIRMRRKITQEELGEMIGVQRAQISKLEKGEANMTLGTLLRVFSAMRADISFKIDAR
jgi:HTH-type transcriptional regulator / antitoxin HipB